MAEYRYTLGRSHAKFVFEILKTRPSGGGAQGSYNIPREMFDELKNSNIIVKKGTASQGEDYYLQDNVRLELSNNVLSLIGDNYRNINNKFFIRFAYSNHKPQLFRKAYADKHDNSYNWFVALYDANCVNSTVKFIFNEATRTLTIDLENNITSTIVENDIVAEESETYVANNSVDLEPGCNVIYYGIPGCGKSYKVDQIIREVYPNREDYNKNVFRTTFYLDYDNSDFIGQIIPYTEENGGIKYKPNFGPFTKALKRARKTDEMVYLVIEEINRGNAAAIFGDTFQLLDRLDKDKAIARQDGSKAGESEYPITNTFIEEYLGIPQGEVKIPSNLTIYATMNTSDQNVFPLDTAFKRRWNRIRVIPDWDEGKVSFRNKYIPFTDLTWYTFAKRVNEKMESLSGEGIILEDKQLGPFFANENMFVSAEERNIDNERNRQSLQKFVYNVIDYIWNDVSKFNRDEWFTKESYNSVLDEISKYHLGSNIRKDFCMTVFAQDEVIGDDMDD